MTTGKALLLAITAPALAHPVASAERMANTLAGKSGGEIVAEPEIRRMAPKQGIEAIARLMEASSPAKVADGRFIIVRGCAFNQCSFKASFLAIDDVGGGVFMAWTEHGGAGISTSANAAWKRTFLDGPSGVVDHRLTEWKTSLAPILPR